MTEWLVQNDTISRLTVFTITFGIMLVLERALPNRKWRPALGDSTLIKRQLVNLSLTAINTIALRALPFISASLASIWASNNNFGVFHWLEFNQASQFVLSIILLDFCIYWQHRYFHYNKFLWRLHKVHHCDKHLDASTALRFHPVEIVISMLLKSFVAILLGVPLAGLIAFEIILNASALFNHANIKLPLRVDKVLKVLIVTPSMHTIHHSTYKEETNSNYGFFLSIWDRIFHSYKSSCYLNKIIIGISEFDNKKVSSISKLIKLPFMK
jgi:sterol desaturase/sphingolipid hydroxylase (fatty acid hydroxylase superfamily)